MGWSGVGEMLGFVWWVKIIVIFPTLLYSVVMG